MGDSREKSLRFDSNTDSVEGEKVFEEKRNYRSDITGMSVRLKSELVFEMRRNLQDVFIRYLKEYYTGDCTTSSEVKYHMTKERTIDEISRHVFSVLSQGEVTAERIQKAMEEGFEDIRRDDGPLLQNFKEFWKRL